MIFNDIYTYVQVSHFSTFEIILEVLPWRIAEKPLMDRRKTLTAEVLGWCISHQKPARPFLYQSI